MSRPAGGEVADTVDAIQQYDNALAKMRSIDSELAKVKAETSAALSRGNYARVAKLKTGRADLVKTRNTTQIELAALKHKAKALRKLRADHSERNSETAQLARQRTKLLMSILEVLKSIDGKLPNPTLSLIHI